MENLLFLHERAQFYFHTHVVEFETDIMQFAKGHHNEIKLNNRIVIIPEFPLPVETLKSQVKKIWHSKIIFSAIGGDIFEYCVGERKTFTEDESKNLTRQLAQALEFIHSKYIVHLDVKPQNILLSKGICLSWMYVYACVCYII